jgi:exodeoxyribonuclease VII small subunit
MWKELNPTRKREKGKKMADQTDDITEVDNKSEVDNRMEIEKKGGKVKKGEKNSEPTFEEALERLESIVAAMESDNISLDDAISKFEEGIALSRVCHRKLGRAAGKIELLVRDAQESISLEEYDFKTDRKEL